MKLNIKECTKQDLIRLVSQYIKETPYTNKEEIADSILDGSWTEYFNCSWENRK